jgi:hypothetical protein
MGVFKSWLLPLAHHQTRIKIQNGRLSASRTRTHIVLTQLAILWSTPTSATAHWAVLSPKYHCFVQSGTMRKKGELQCLLNHERSRSGSHPSSESLPRKCDVSADLCGPHRDCAAQTRRGYLFNVRVRVIYQQWLIMISRPRQPYARTSTLDPIESRLISHPTPGLFLRPRRQGR